MEKEKLTVNHLKGYLDTEVKLLMNTDSWTYPEGDKIVYLRGILDQGDYISFQYDKPNEKTFGNFVMERFKLILYPLSSLTKEQLEEFSICFRMWYDKPNFDYKLMIYSDVELCYKHHVDIFGLIEKKLAINAETLKDNPYTK